MFGLTRSHLWNKCCGSETLGHWMASLGSQMWLLVFLVSDMTAFLSQMDREWKRMVHKEEGYFKQTSSKSVIPVRKVLYMNLTFQAHMKQHQWVTQENKNVILIFEPKPFYKKLILKSMFDFQCMIPQPLGSVSFPDVDPGSAIPPPDPSPAFCSFTRLPFH